LKPNAGISNQCVENLSKLSVEMSTARRA
jgi:hypothetical protein